MEPFRQVNVRFTQVAIIAFSDVTESSSPSGVPSCYDKSLAQGTPENKIHLKRQIDKIQKHGGNKYVGALVKAFRLLAHNATRDAKKNRGQI